jgi:pimeloyl-ACP methyl ester carboxylesterase
MTATVALHVERRGTGEPIVFTHGFGESWETWRPQVEGFAATHRVIAWDLRGHGASDRPEAAAAYSRDLALADLTRIVRDEAGRSALLVGHSLGGYLSLALAVTQPEMVRGLVLIACGPGFRDVDARAAWNERVERVAESLGLPDAVAGIVRQPDALVIDGARAVTAPCVIIVGEGDRRFHAGSEYLARALDAPLLVVPGAGHHPHASHAEAVNDAITRLATEVHQP